MQKVTNTRFLVSQFRTHPYQLACSHLYLKSLNISSKNTSDLIHNLLTLFCTMYEDEHGKAFENNEDALDYCVTNALAFSTRNRESIRQQIYRSAVSLLKSNEANKHLKEIEDSHLEFDRKVAELMHKEGLTEQEAATKLIMES